MPLSVLSMIGSGIPEIILLFCWSLIPMGLYFYLRSTNRERPVTGMEYLVMIPLFLLFGWLTLLCIWLISRIQKKPLSR